jgi:hypothetical protein
VKIKAVTANNRRKTFDLVIGAGVYSFPYAKCEPVPTAADPVRDLIVDPELAREGATYTLASGKEGSILADQVLYYNRDPAIVRDLLLYNLTVQAQDRLAESPLSKREVIRRLGTSASQFYRLMDQTNYTKSVDQMIGLLQALDCEVDVSVRARSA